MIETFLNLLFPNEDEQLTRRALAHEGRGEEQLAFPAVDVPPGGVLRTLLMMDPRKIPSAFYPADSAI